MFEVAELADRCRKAALDDVGLAGDAELYEAVVQLAVARAGLDAAEGHVLAELEARGCCDREFGLGTVSWVADRTRVPRGVGTRVRVATKLPRLGGVDAALGEGRIGFDHARVLADAANPRIADQLEAAQDQLVDQAGRLPFVIWRRAVGELVELWDQDGGYDPDRELARNRLRLRQVGDTTVIDGELVGETALVVGQAVEAETDRLWRRYRSDTEVCGELDLPSRATLRALALAEICRQAQASDPATTTAPAVDVTLVIHTDQPDMVRTPDGDRVTPEAGAHLWCDPVLHTLLIDGRSVPLDLKRSARFATPAQRRALAVRDGGCVFPGCDRPPSWTDAHHLTAYQHGGATDLHNLASLCRHHHGVTHRQGWTMTATPDQTFTFTTPSGHTLHSQRHRAPP